MHAKASVSQKLKRNVQKTFRKVTKEVFFGMMCGGERLVREKFEASSAAMFRRKRHQTRYYDRKAHRWLNVFFTILNKRPCAEPAGGTHGTDFIWRTSCPCVYLLKTLGPAQKLKVLRLFLTQQSWIFVPFFNKFWTNVSWSSGSTKIKTMALLKCPSSFKDWAVHSDCPRRCRRTVFLLSLAQR